MHTLETEIEQNFDFFMREVAHYLPKELGRFALMQGRGIKGFYDTLMEAEFAGARSFPDGIFSIQEVTDRPEDLGYFSYAFDQGQAGEEPAHY